MKPILILAAFTLTLQAQQNTPHAGYVYPAGGRQGDTFEVIVGGQFLDGVNKALISGPGVQTTIADFVKPITQGQFNKLREQLQELTDKKKAAKSWTEADDKTMADIRLKIATFIRRPMTPAIAENVHLKITLDANAAPGERELRLVTPSGVTNPIVFCISQLPEISKKAAKVESEIKQTPKKAAKTRAQLRQPTGPETTEVTLPVMINGQVTPGGLDRYRFPATKGQHLVVAANVRELIPYISDAVPGWFQAAIGLYDATGKEVSYADHYGFHQDPVLYYEIPADGQYTLQIHDSVYRGREDFVYRIAVGEFPYVTSIFPLGGKAGVKTAVEVKGWNLPPTRLTESFKSPGIYPVAIGASNHLPFAVDTLAEVLAREPNNTPATAQRVKLPLIVNGRIGKPGDLDIFRFEGRAGEEIVAEVMARRLDSPLDSILKLTDAKGKQIAMNDDFEDKAAALITHQADSFIQIKLPAAGSYYLSISDTQHKGGPDYAYRLRISHPQQDYQLRVTPSSISARGGQSVPVTVYALRKDGFSGEIELKLKDAPAGFVLSGGWIPANQASARMTLTLPPRKMDGAVDLHLEGRSKLDGKDVVRQGIPAEDMMQAFYYHHLVTEDAWLARVANPARGSKNAAWKVMTDKRVQIPLDGQAPPVKVFLPLGRYAPNVQLVLNDPPEGIVIDKVGLFENGVNIFLKTNGKAKPGLAGNLLVDAFIDLENTSNVAAKKRRTTLGLLPAIPFTVAAN